MAIRTERADRRAFATKGARSINADLSEIITTEIEVLPLAQFDYSDGVNLCRQDRVEEQEVVVELDSDEILSAICDALGRDHNLVRALGKKGQLEKCLHQLEDLIKRGTGFSLSLVELFKHDPLIRTAIQLIAKGFLASPKFDRVIENKHKIIFLADANNIYLEMNTFGKGLHKHKNRLAVTSLDERLLNRAPQGYFGSFGNFTGVVRACQDIQLTKAPEKKKVPVSTIRALPKRELAELVLDGVLSLQDLRRAGLDTKIIHSIETLLD